MPGNIDFLRFWNSVSRCFHFVGTMEGIYPVSLNWTDIETMARITHVKLTPRLLQKLSVAEQKTIEESTTKRK